MLSDEQLAQWRELPIETWPIDVLQAEVERLRAEVAQYDVALGHAHDSADFRASILSNERESLWHIAKRLKSQNAAMHALLAELAASNAVAVNRQCSHCGAMQRIMSDRKTFRFALTDDYEHTPDCLITRVRTQLAQPEEVSRDE